MKLPHKRSGTPQPLLPTQQQQLPAAVAAAAAAAAAAACTRRLPPARPRDFPCMPLPAFMGLLLLLILSAATTSLMYGCGSLSLDMAGQQGLPGHLDPDPHTEPDVHPHNAANPQLTYDDARRHTLSNQVRLPHNSAGSSTSSSTGASSSHAPGTSHCASRLRQMAGGVCVRQAAACTSLRHGPSPRCPWQSQQQLPRVQKYQPLMW
mmetsp:Transcript_22279/g.48666  ORF Transcript_22279/g.48666 Transcript_22279/m.48666 type:complete len:207 (-) Transcript_22279:425-1045(-)|eukprot:CAMPEP_0202895234 /NCGR_PEP_ID=MMETSP1392-20130828/4476_1 /ASSEMBLY_ACC=CAM_ASM_000868 /TAXON_ID=225041 /ORGANISM="Chlamydomonas chlamydogama, Strain SAG 11-48b" /LENGTH=206 /DNA_ID=CAMNT_0049580173 /DNA_START=597 /DNA_END=1220 /DNA_ORIENTATION=+